MPVRQQCPRQRELPVAGDLVDEGVTFWMLKVFVKKLDAVAAGWDPEPCRWLGRVCVPKP